MVTDANVGNHDMTENENTLSKSCTSRAQVVQTARSFTSSMSDDICYTPEAPEPTKSSARTPGWKHLSLLGVSTVLYHGMMPKLSDHLQTWETIIFVANMGEANTTDQEHHFFVMIGRHGRDC